ncbi:NUT family member 1 [Erinaceus europaeus]|uniref:NUT family member 1 n=1 Tax=Erinaceus europaeus TaxID=9365 RepID=A0ABM3W0T4_ERIEU|nr:NUT family member 1 [Erinaceus europaeus]
MTSDGASPLPGPDMTMKPGATLSSFSAIPLSPPGSDWPDQPTWEPPPTQPSMSSAFPPSSPLVLSTYPSPMLVTGSGGPGPSGVGGGKVIVKVKTEGGPAEPSQAQNFILTQTALNWIASGTSDGPPPQYVTATNVKPFPPPKAAPGISQESLPAFPLQALPPPAAQLAPIVPPEKAWPGPHGAVGEGGPEAAPAKPSLGDLAYTSKGVYENFRRWQRYKTLAQRHESQSPDVEALSCFLIPVLRSLARLKPTMTLEEGLPRAVQEWERTSNFDRMIFYEMAEKFMEFESEEEIQIQNTQLMNGSQGLPPAAPVKLSPPGPQPPEVCQPPVYIPKKAASKARAPRRRQRKTQRPPATQAPKEIPPEAVKEYADIMEGLAVSLLATTEPDDKQEEEQPQEAWLYPDLGLLNYMDDLCSQEDFVSKVEAVIHPRFLEDLLSPEQQRDPLALIEELEQEEGLSLAELVEKRLLALEEDEDTEAPLTCSGAQSDSSPSISDEDEEGGGRLRLLPGSRVVGGSICLGKAASPGKRVRDIHNGQEQALDGMRWVHRDGVTQPLPRGWDLQLPLAVPLPLGTETRGSGKVPGHIPPHQDDSLGRPRSLELSLVAGQPSEVLPLCWQEAPQLEIVPDLDVGLTELAPLQGQSFEEQGLGLQTGQQMGGLGEHPLEELSAAGQETSSGAIWGEDRGPLIVQNYENCSPRAAGDRDSLSPGFWLSSDMVAVDLELPFQIEEVTENFHTGDCVAEPQGGSGTPGSKSNISLASGEATAPGDAGDSIVPCRGSDVTVAVEERNYYSLQGAPKAYSPVSQEHGEPSPGTTLAPSELWAEDYAPLLDSRIASPVLGASKETFLPACQDHLLILGTLDASFPEASHEDGSRGTSIFPLLETTEYASTPDIGDAQGLQLGVFEDICPPDFDSHDPQRKGREDADLSKFRDLAPSAGDQESHAHKILKSMAFPQSHGSVSSVWATRDGALVPRESYSPVSGSAVRAAAKEEDEEEEEEEEDESLSSFAYLLASKLSLSTPGLPPGLASGLPPTGQGSQSVSHSLSAEASSLSQASNSAANPGMQASVGGSSPVGKRPHLEGELGVSEKPLALEVVRSTQPRKRRCDSFALGRRKKRRRSQ